MITRLILLAGAIGLAAGGAGGAWGQSGPGPISPPKPAEAKTSPPPAPPATPQPSSTPAQPAAQGTATQVNASSKPMPPVEEVIRAFAAKEAEFRRARDNYTYTQTVLIQELDVNGHRGGEYRRTSDIVFTPEGKRYEHSTYEPPSTLQAISISREDEQDMISIQPFVLATADLPQYVLEYAGRESVDDITAYVFNVRPRQIEPGQRYFEGKIWVDDMDLQIVKTYGKAVPDIRTKKGENLFPRFETYRENIDGKYWFPTYTRADDVLHFSTGDVRLRITIRYTNYKQFKSTVRILSSEPLPPNTPPAVTKPPQPPKQ